MEKIRETRNFLPLLIVGEGLILQRGVPDSGARGWGRWGGGEGECRSASREMKRQDGLARVADIHDPLRAKVAAGPQTAGRDGNAG